MNTVNLGLRNGGGIGDSLKITMYIDNKSAYLPKVVLVNILFFLIINLVFLNIIFGIIIDTFGELRDGIFERGILKSFFLFI
jgi:inositol 1,4,5-triphosphate receptor type 1